MSFETGHEEMIVSHIHIYIQTQHAIIVNIAAAEQEAALLREKALLSLLAALKQ